MPLITPKTRVKVIDVNRTRISKLNAEMDGSHTKVGFPKGENVASGDQNTMADVATIAALLNFGISTKSGEKKWPFMSLTFHENKNAIRSMLRSEYKKVLNGKSTAKRSLGLIGEFVVNKTKMKITVMKSPALEPETIKRKGSSNPLIDSGQMRNTVTHVEVIK